MEATRRVRVSPTTARLLLSTKVSIHNNAITARLCSKVSIVVKIAPVLVGVESLPGQPRNSQFIGAAD